MYKRILIATDGSKLAAKAVVEGLRLAQALKSEIVAVMVTSETPGSVVAGPMVVIAPPEAVEQMTAFTKRTLGDIADGAERLGIPCESVHVTSEIAYRAILETAKTKGCDLIVMASHGHGGLKAAVLGSVTMDVLAHSAIPVLVCR
ncbi:MAG: universal stress protein [Hyphomicrobiaceae bacterium]